MGGDSWPQMAPSGRGDEISGVPIRASHPATGKGQPNAQPAPETPVQMVHTETVISREDYDF